MHLWFALCKKDISMPEKQIQQCINTLICFRIKIESNKLTLKLFCHSFTMHSVLLKVNKATVIISLFCGSFEAKCPLGVTNERN